MRQVQRHWGEVVMVLNGGENTFSLKDEMEGRVGRGNHSRSQGEALLDIGMQARTDNSSDGKKLKEIPGDQKVSLGQWISLVCGGEHKHGVFFPQEDINVCYKHYWTYLDNFVSFESGFKFPYFNTSNMTLIWDNFPPAAWTHLWFKFSPNWNIIQVHMNLMYSVEGK